MDTMKFARELGSRVTFLIINNRDRLMNRKGETVK